MGHALMDGGVDLNYDLLPLAILREEPAERQFAVLPNILRKDGSALPTYSMTLSHSIRPVSGGINPGRAPHLNNALFYKLYYPEADPKSSSGHHRLASA